MTTEQYTQQAKLLGIDRGAFEDGREFAYGPGAMGYDLDSGIDHTTVKKAPPPPITEDLSRFMSLRGKYGGLPVPPSTAPHLVPVYQSIRARGTDTLAIALTIGITRSAIAKALRGAAGPTVTAKVRSALTPAERRMLGWD